MTSNAVLTMGSLALLLCGRAHAQQASAAAPGDDAAAPAGEPPRSSGDPPVATRAAEEIRVTSEADPLDAQSETATRLGLSVRETPATIDILNQRELQRIGARTTEEALNRAPGVTSNAAATSPGMLSIRGFTGSGNAVLLLYDGVRPAEEVFFTRVMDSWMFETIDILKGPSSVGFGDSALAGVVNLVPKQPRLGVQRVAGQLGFGSFGTARAAADANIAVLDNLAIRPVVAYSRSSGHVDDTSSQFLAASVAARWAPAARLTVDLAFDHAMDDYRTAYFGTPLVPRAAARDPVDLVTSADGWVLDRALRSVNYNVEDAVVDSDTQWLRSGIKYQFSDAWSLANEARFYLSDRRFINAEYFGFDPEAGSVDRSTGVVTHDFQYWIDRATLRGDLAIAGLRNRLAVGG